MNHVLSNFRNLTENQNTMKKLLPLALLVLGPISIFGQTIFNEDFSNLGGSLPAGWTVIDVDGLTPNTSVAQFTSAWIIAGDFDNAADTVAMSNSWYTPAGQSNDWLVTPQITLTANNVLNWEAESQDINYLESYEVRISTTTPTVAGFNANPALTTITNENGAVWTQRNVAIPTTYNGQNVYIAWRNISTDEFILMVDDISITTNQQYDAEITNTTSTEYTVVPLPQATGPMSFTADITNNGSSAVTAVAMKVNVYNGVNTNVYTSTSTAMATLASGATAPFTVTGFSPTSADDYTIELINLIAETDGIPTNDTTSFSMTISDTIYARDDDNATGSLGIGAGTAGELGQNFTLTNADTLTSVSFHLTNNGGSMNGQPIFAKIYATNATGTPTTVLAQTDTVIIDATTDTLWTSPISGSSLQLAAGTYTVVMQELDSNITIGTTPNIFTLGTTWVRFGTTPWTNNEGFNFNVSYLLRANFGDPVCISTSSQTTIGSCVAITSPSGNYTWTTSGTYMDTIPNVAGCDSIITVTLTISSVSTSTISANSCAPYTSPSGNYIWTTSGTYMDTVPTTNCDSVITVNLTVGAPSSSQMSVSSCGDYTSPSGNLWTTSGMYTDTIPNASGCDSVMTIDLTVNAIDIITTVSGPTATANAVGATYQWVDCDANFAAIPGETNQGFIATVTGNYAVIVTENGCTDTSACVAISVNGLDEFNSSELIVFPNPSDGTFVVTFTNSISGATNIRILSMDGKLVYSKENNLISNSNELSIDASGIPSGYYVLEVDNENKLFRKPIIIK